MYNYSNILKLHLSSLHLCFYTKPLLTFSGVFHGRQDVTKDYYTSVTVEALSETHKRANRENVMALIFPVGAFFGQSTQKNSHGRWCYSNIDTKTLPIAHARAFICATLLASKHF